MQAEQVTGPVAYHGEGPVWSPRWGGLRWVDMLAGDVLTLADGGIVRRRHVGTVAAAVRIATALVHADPVVGPDRVEDGESPVGCLQDEAALHGDDRAAGPARADGRFWCGSMAYDQAPGAAAMYRLDPDGTVRPAFGGVTVSNGLEWSPDGSVAYYADTATHRVDLFDYDPDTGLSGRRPFVQMGGDTRPDGLTVDADGGVWVALNGSGAVHRYRADGVLDDVVELPTAKVTACTLGGPGLDELFVTTSREGLGPDDDPLAGSLYRVDVGVRGLPVREFAG